MGVQESGGGEKRCGQSRNEVGKEGLRVVPIGEEKQEFAALRTIEATRIWGTIKKDAEVRLAGWEGWKNCRLVCSVWTWHSQNADGRFYQPGVIGLNAGVIWRGGGGAQGKSRAEEKLKFGQEVISCRRRERRRAIFVQNEGGTNLRQMGGNYQKE